jgi:ABC-type sugar transport system permease subunit
MNPSAPPLARKRFPWILYWILLALIVLFTVAPIGSVIACSVMAHAYGCHVDEGSVHPCIVNGQDYGHLLYTLGVLGWLMLFTLPAGVFAFLIWLIVLILHRQSWKKRVAGVPPPIPPAML